MRLYCSEMVRDISSRMMVMMWSYKCAKHIAEFSKKHPFHMQKSPKTQHKNEASLLSLTELRLCHLQETENSEK